MTDGTEFVSRLLDVIENDVVPLTRGRVAAGNKVFGAAILRKVDCSVVVAESNLETENPLWHGEVHALKSFYEIPADERPDTGDCIFLATHEPCSLCLSAITWTGFDNFYHLFGYTDTVDIFNIRHDLRILDEVFKVRNGAYARHNRYWKSYSIADLVDGLSEPAKITLSDRMTMLEATYRTLSDTYQGTKTRSDLPLS